MHQHIEHGVAVLATGQADHDLVAVFNHVEIGNRLTGLTAKALLQFVLVDRKSAHDAKSVRCDERRAFYAKTPQGRSVPPKGLPGTDPAAINSCVYSAICSKALTPSGETPPYTAT
ncbi:hypothetical protein D3C81_1386120 [compost metagenome]